MKRVSLIILAVAAVLVGSRTILYIRSIPAMMNGIPEIWGNIGGIRSSYFTRWRAKNYTIVPEALLSKFNPNRDGGFSTEPLEPYHR